MRKDWVARELTIEIIVGVFMVLILLGLGYFTIILSQESWFGAKVEIDVVFENVMGLREGDSVVSRGMPIGKVKALSFQKDGVHVTAQIEPDIKLRICEDYRITVVSTSILGGRYLQIDEGGGECPELPLETTLYRGEKPYDLMADASALVNKARGSMVEGGAIDNFKDVSEELKEIAERLGQGKGTLGKLLSEDDQLYTDLSASAASIRKIAEKIEKGEGMMGQLMQDEEMYGELKETVREIRAAVDDFREMTPVATFTSIFFGAF